MSRKLVAATFFGVAFGFLISWGQFNDPERIRQMLLVEDLYLYEMMASAIVVGFAGIHLLRRRHAKALVTGEPISWQTVKPEPRHITGAVLFGLGWAVTDSCPAPIAAQLAQGVAWSIVTAAGVFLGIFLFFRRQEQRVARSAERAPRRERQPATVSALASDQ
jgi:uncharacterized protein